MNKTELNKIFDKKFKVRSNIEFNELLNNADCKFNKLKSDLFVSSIFNKNDQEFLTEKHDQQKEINHAHFNEWFKSYLMMKLDDLKNEWLIVSEKK